MAFVPSDRQQAIAAALREPRNLLIQACAGSGKTTTMVWLAGLLPPHMRVLALSFNRSIAEELGRRMPSYVRSATMHSIGYGMIRKSQGRVRLEDKKLVWLVDTHPGVIAQSPSVRHAVVSDLLAIVPLVQDTMIDPDNLSMLSAIADMVGRELEAASISLPLVASISAACDQMRGCITYGEMIRHPIIHNDPPDYFDVVFVDEAQDLNSAQHALLKRLVRPIQGKLVAVGDAFQSVYNFRGADPRSMDRLASDWDMTKLPLDVSYRCAAAIVKEAQSIVGPDAIKARPDAPAGEVQTGRYDDLGDLMNEGDMGICRCNAPLIGAALRCIKAGKRVQIRGRDVGSQLAALVRRARATTVAELLGYIVRWRASRVQAGIASKKSLQALQAIDDQADTLTAIAEECSDVQGVIEALDDLFSDLDRPCIVFSTVHRAKGLEAATVVILGPELLPAPWAESAAEKEQERNLHYVAVTRALTRLVYVKLPDKRK